MELERGQLRLTPDTGLEDARSARSSSQSGRDQADRRPARAGRVVQGEVEVGSRPRPAATSAARYACRRAAPGSRRHARVLAVNRAAAWRTASGSSASLASYTSARSSTESSATRARGARPSQPPPRPRAEGPPGREAFPSPKGSVQARKTMPSPRARSRARRPAGLTGSAIAGRGRPSRPLSRSRGLPAVAGSGGQVRPYAPGPGL